MDKLWREPIILLSAGAALITSLILLLAGAGLVEGVIVTLLLLVFGVTLEVARRQVELQHFNLVLTHPQARAINGVLQKLLHKVDGLDRIRDRIYLWHVDRSLKEVKNKLRNLDRGEMIGQSQPFDVWDRLASLVQWLAEEEGTRAQAVFYCRGDQLWAGVHETSYVQACRQASQTRKIAFQRVFIVPKSFSDGRLDQIQRELELQLEDGVEVRVVAEEVLVPRLRRDFVVFDGRYVASSEFDSAGSFSHDRYLVTPGAGSEDKVEEFVEIFDTLWRSSTPYHGAPLREILAKS